MKNEFTEKNGTRNNNTGAYPNVVNLSYVCERCSTCSKCEVSSIAFALMQNSCPNNSNRG